MQKQLRAEHLMLDYQEACVAAGSPVPRLSYSGGRINVNGKSHTIEHVESLIAIEWSKLNERHH